MYYKTISADEDAIDGDGIVRDGKSIRVAIFAMDGSTVSVPDHHSIIQDMVQRQYTAADFARAIRDI